MATVRSPRRRLPARVYWVRRGLVAVLALLLVVGISRLIGTGSDAPAAVDKATQTSGAGTGGEPSSPSTTGAAVGPVAPGKKLLRQQAKLARALPAPDGPCGDDEITVRPSVAKAAAGGEIAIELQLFGTRPACTFTVSPDTLVVKVASGADGIWTSQDCKKSITKGSVTVYSGTPAIVPVIWNGRRSEAGCGPGTSWAMPGFYHVLAAAQGSTPSDTQFQVTLPDHPVVTRTIKPKAQKKASPAPGAEKSPSASSSPKSKKSAAPKP